MGLRRCGPRVGFVTQIRIADAAHLLNVSDDTVRRWIDDGRLDASAADSGPRTVDGASLAALAVARAGSPDDSSMLRSARNQFTGLVTRVIADGVMAQVELQCGPNRIVSLMSSEAARELELAPGVVATAVVKATTVIIERPRAATETAA